jgi:hypothetical protein
VKLPRNGTPWLLNENRNILTWLKSRKKLSLFNRSMKRVMRSSKEKRSR